MALLEQRKKLRALLAGSKCIVSASIYDPLSARVAESVGFEVGFLMGSIASAAVLAAPDLVVLTLSELADHIRRIARASRLSLVVDADHGFGNALNVMRTLQELEHAGVAALTIEDTALPMVFGQVLVGERFGHAESGDLLISIEEGVGKMRAAVKARCDPALVIVARTSALKVEGIENTLTRAKAYAVAGVDAIYLSSQPDKLAIQAIHAATRLPVIFGAGLAVLNLEELAASGTGLVTQSAQQPMAAATRALRETYTHLFNGGMPADLTPKIAERREMDQLVSTENYRSWLDEYMS